MKIKNALKATAVTAGAVLGLSLPAQAASNYTGPGTDLTLTTYGATRTGFGPVAPTSTPATSTITGVSYTISTFRPQSAPGVLQAQICYTGAGCAAASYPSGSTTAFNGKAANKDLYFKFTWASTSPYVSGTIKGGVQVSDTITVNYS